MTREALYTATARNSCNNKLKLPQPTRRHSTLVAYLSVLFHITESAFLKKTREADLQFFLTFFWQNIFGKQTQGDVKFHIIKALSARTAFWYTPYHIPEQIIRRYDNARLRVWFRLYHGVILSISAPDIGNNTCWNGVYCRTKKRSSNINL